MTLYTAMCMAKIGEIIKDNETGKLYEKGSMIDSGMHVPAAFLKNEAEGPEILFSLSDLKHQASIERR